MTSIRPLMFVLAAGFALGACAMSPNEPVADKPAPPQTGPVEPPVAIEPSPEPAPGEPAMECDAKTTGWAIGQQADATLIERIKTETHAERARVLKPGQMVTMEFLATRVNIDVDGDNRVLKVRCG